MRHVFEYAVLRVVPRVERAEFVNAGVVLYCRGLDYLAARTLLDPARLAALDPAADADAVRSQLAAVGAVCEGTPDAGPAGRGAPGERFRWLVAPRSTVVQLGPVHTGLTADPAVDLERLLRLLVHPSG